MEENYEHFIMAGAASGGYYTPRASYYLLMKKDNKVFNLQLRYWVEALTKFNELNEDNFTLEEALLIIQALCSSLEALAGQNIKPTDKTPPLIVMFEETLKNDRGWDICLEKPDLFKGLKEIDTFHKNLSKHINRYTKRKELLKEINYKKIRDYMNLIRDIWTWVLNKIFNGKIPEDQLQFFRLDFNQADWWSYISLNE